MTTAPFEPRAALECLARHGVDFVVIGGIAMRAYGSARLTEDLDIVFAPEPANLEHLGAALMELDAQLRGVPEDVPFVPDSRALRQIELLTLETSAGDLDVHVQPQGAPTYARLRDQAERVEIGGFQVLVASIEDLRDMKRAAGRIKDLADLAELDAIERLRKEAP